MSEHQKVQKWTQKPPGQKKTFAERKLGSKRGKCKKKKTERKSIGKKGAFVCCRTKSLNTGWQMRKWKQNFRDCKLENKEEVAMHRKRLISGWRRWWNRSSPWERTRRGRSSMLCVKYSSRDSRLSAPPAQVPGREEGRRDSENEQEQGRTSQQLVLPTPGGSNQDAPASSLELDLHRVEGAPGESGSAGRSSKQGDRKGGPSRSPGRHSMDEEENDNVGGVVP